MRILKRAITGLAHSKLVQLDALYQRHADQECYLFGDGISLKWMELRHFADKPSIIGNKIIYHREAGALNKPYCSLTQPYELWRIYPYHGWTNPPYVWNRQPKEYKKSVAANPNTLFIFNISNYLAIRATNTLFVTRWYKPPVGGANPFRDRPDSHTGTLPFQISLAIFLGFKSATLVGHDYTHEPSKFGHFYEKGRGVPAEHGEHLVDFLKYARQHIDLTTVTIDAGSTKMKSIRYKDYTGAEPRFRENTELLDRVKLDSLATWPGYEIY